MKILVIVDDNEINKMICDLLTLNQIETVSAYSGTEGLLIMDTSIDIILLDIMLPGKSGQEVLKEIKEKYNTPVIALTAINDMTTKLDIFALGADDYIVKPFNGSELLARIKIQARHIQVHTIEEVIRYKDIKIDTNNYEVTCNNQKIAVSKTEYQLLKILLENPTRVFTKDTLFEMVWQYEDSGENTLNVHISKIRSKLKQANPNQEYIETVWGIGYKAKS